jgi:lycopene beta-cyclase
MSSKHYHYIITGAGCAGLSLLMRMMEDPFFFNKSILVIDQSAKQTNDRTWCFWEQKPGLFEPIVHHRWNTIQFHSNDFSSILNLGHYQYKMIQGLDFYQYVLNKAAQFSNIEFCYERVASIHSENNQAFVHLESKVVSADFVFNSIRFQPINTKKYQFLQHFTGWVIETDTACFNQSEAIFMDFRISQKNGTSFMYVLPVSEKKALIEYTLFTPTLLPKEAYENELKTYIGQQLHISNYTITHEEIGVIPMTNQPFELQKGRMINIGIEGGQAKGSSGFAFQFIQKRTAAIIKGLKHNQQQFVSISMHQRKGQFYDSVLLNVLHHKKLNGNQIFSAIFKSNQPETVLRFLDNESSLLDDLKIMSSVPTRIFLKAAIQELLH